MRPGRAEDAAEVAHVFSAARAALDYLPQVHSEAEHRRYFGEQLATLPSWLALRGQSIVGFVIFGAGWVHHLYVRPDAQRRGVGGALLARVKAESEGGLALWTFQRNGGARRFYERQGFVVVEQTDGQNNEERLPDVRYAWRRG